MLTLTPQARALTAFTLSLLVVTGYLNRLAFAAYVVGGGDLPGGRSSRFVLSLLTIVLAAGVFWFARTATQGLAPGWETSLAQAARFIAVIGVVIAVLATLGVLTNDGPFFGAFSLTS
jgi:hypothetical protein